MTVVGCCVSGWLLGEMAPSQCQWNSIIDDDGRQKWANLAAHLAN
jgi:hypothetical protein